ncbi:uncharacterized protein LOC121641518 [Melanotaenia boesemani]|uniref:uncharacterized protein LOC121641518 n=1 Tax=Melanotaenia boesemani TaxID=1250792 RepID=UPI001C05D98B|nr:uncharacterized protein LOC121641518 [Melanotaenia boesemani]XP_041843635.1 uncharacterized protein LOC121641518 [Melanotaenia boesemani]XP_041843636.1 uncharacterized protein LOC121641518 [Melanotaenia boesemani]
MAELELLEPLVIREDGDTTEDIREREATGSADAIVRSCSEESALKKEEEHLEDSNQEAVASKMCLQEKQQAETEAGRFKPEPDNENANDGQNRDSTEGEGQTLEVVVREKPSNTEDKNVTENEHQVDTKRLDSSKPEKEEKQKEDSTKAHRLTPDFPEALYELLCTLQEGRRLNDQRCSFRMEVEVRRRRCHSEPNTTKPANRVVFSSMTSLQKEEFFELVATAQARRLDDQRAQLERSPPPKPKSRSFRGSLKQLSFVKKPAPPSVCKDDLYDMILTTQAQGRLEDQRSRAPGPMDDEDFFSLLLRVQGGRMDEQRTELPCLLQT